jgi:integrase
VDDGRVDDRPQDDAMRSIPLLDRAGRRRSPATTSPFHQGVTPGNKGLRYPPDPPTVEEIIAVMHAAGHDLEGVRLRGVIVVLWRAGLRISEALALNETDFDPERGALLVRHGKGPTHVEEQGGGGNSPQVHASRGRQGSRRI